MPPIALDTSVAIPLLVQTHRAHHAVVSWWDGREIALSGHALAETYSVLTRLPDDLRLAPRDAARLIDERFAPPLLVGARIARRLPEVLSKAGVAGGAVYDALVALAAVEHRCQLATRDARAKATYEAMGAHVLVVG
ncbi:MAG TPA: type II toxin-antitoxin system VapC family toxin [Jatrophihabitantaceae bacterium]|nr:type II toxin-antitoxin system VapC family toxin [Jatrophihabitantaceae bacterium]